jgi:hypothetical protein
MGAYEESYDFRLECLKIRENLYQSDHPDLAHGNLKIETSAKND